MSDLQEQHEGVVRELSQDVAARAEWFEQLTAALQQVFFVATPSYDQFFFISPAYDRIWGRSRTELYANPTAWKAGIHPDDLPRVAEFFETCCGRGTYETEYRVVRPDGTQSIVQDHSTEISGPDGVPLRVVGIIEDITERKRGDDELHEQRRMLQTLLSNMPGMAYRCRNDPDWTMEYISEGCRALTGYGPEDLIGSRTMSFGVMIHAEDRDRLWRTVQHHLEQRLPFQLVYRIKTQDGTEKWVWEQGRGVYSADGALCALEGFITDVSDVKRAERSLLDSQIELEQRVAERTADLQASTVRLAVQYEVTRVLVEAEDIQCGMRGILRAACESLGWDYGVWWSREGDPDVLSLGVEWIGPADGPAALQAANRHATFTLGAGLPGRVWSSASPVWIPDLADAKAFMRVDAAAEDGLHTVFAFPVGAGDEFLGVMEFFSHDIRPEDESVLSLSGFIGDQVGMFVTRKRAEGGLRQSEERLQSIIDGATAAIYVKQVDGRFLLVNKQFENLLHVQRDSVIGHTDAEFFGQEAADAFRANDLRIINERRVFTFEETVPQDDGVHTYISIKFPLYGPDGSVQGVCGISTDITERKQQEVELREARKQADEANRAKSRFLANMGHEIRTPITAMLGAAELLPLSDGNPEERRRRTDMILRNGRHLLALVDDLLDLSRIETGKFTVRPTRCSLPDLLADIQAVTDPLQRADDVEYSVVYETPVPTYIYTDPTRLKQAAINLISNALKFTDKGFVRVRVRYDLTESTSFLTIVVEDSGIGIPEADLNRIFVAFSQAAQQGGRVAAGAGLGLTISRSIAEGLGGSLTVESQEGAGSRFTLLVDAGPPNSEAWVQPDGSRSSPLVTPSMPRGPRLAGSVLIAEDFLDAREILSASLSAAGADVVAVENGLEAVAACKQHAFDLILLDIRMPELDGLGAASAIRSLGILTPMIALTASTFESDRHRILAAGFDDYWPKPVSMDFLLLGASAYLRSASSEPARAARVARQRVSPAERLAALAVDFRRSLPKRMGELRGALAAGKTERAHHVLHQLAGTCGMYGHDDLSAEAARLQRVLKLSPPKSIGAFLEQLEALMRQACDESPNQET